MRIEILKLLAAKNPKIFRFITCDSIDLREFKKVHLDFNTDSESSEDEIPD